MALAFSRKAYSRIPLAIPRPREQNRASKFQEMEAAGALLGARK